nr:HisA/HisF-related TIM barrel protein [Pleionea sp. CnH1-48]
MSTKVSLPIWHFRPRIKLWVLQKGCKKMLAIPVVEIKSGQCVHSMNHRSKSRGDHDPMETFQRFYDDGARVIQIVDADALRNRQPEHLGLVEKAKKRFPDLKLQITGGVNTAEDILVWLDAGADWITVGGRLAKQLEHLEMILVEFQRKIVVALDVREHLWQQGYCPAREMTVQEWIQLLEEEDVVALMFTEIPETGRVNGHNLIAASELAAKVQLPVIAHGGVNDKQDLANLSQPLYQKLYGVTLGKPMYQGAFSYSEVNTALAH